MSKQESIIRIFLADHQEIFLDGLKQFFSSFENIEVVGESNTDIDLIVTIAQTRPDLVLLDAMLPHTQLSSVVQSIQQIGNNSKVFILYGQYADELLLSLLSAGVHGIASKYISKSELEKAIFQVLNSQSFYCAFTSKKLQHLIQSNRYYPHTKSSQIHFSEKEKVILQCIAAECTSKEIADQLSMSVRTVESYRKSMQEKTGSKNSAGLVLYAIKNGLIPIEKS
ncbi:response regulator transcription factor [Sediminibacterium sp. TEGAF015]|uniref:response regulator transcription factor n=1 Tax=Sediminibacterium sp. TEGAF015 TaxID=575378 RepID=UPI002202EBEF|nr:response regulator transcription factor [Sediminibacterium sp. TEGAF015]BDQ12623.1 DNA-binding response regulator [Sediminibacterium sp. TEGAF015]